MGGFFEGCWGSVQKVVFRIAWRWFQNFAGDAICVIIYFIAFHCIILLSGFRFERKKLSLLLLVIQLSVDFLKSTVLCGNYTGAQPPPLKRKE